MSSCSDRTAVHCTRCIGMLVAKLIGMLVTVESLISSISESSVDFLLVLHVSCYDMNKDCSVLAVCKVL